MNLVACLTFRIILGLTLSGSMLVSCARTEIIESPKTAFVGDTGDHPPPQVVWTSRALDREFDYLGQVNARAWTYDGALERLVEGGQELRADAIIDVHFERVGFLKTMHAFAVKFRD